MGSDNRFVEIRRSALHGEGLFACKHFRKVERVYVLGKEKTIAQKDLRKLSRRKRVYIEKMSENEYDILEPPAWQINHSCRSNIKEKERKGYALRAIRKGEGIMIDYDAVAFLDRPLRCRCSSMYCKRLVRGRK